MADELSERVVPIPEGGAVIIDMLGAVAVRTQPDDENCVLVELAGRLNKSGDRWRGKFMFSVGQAAEMIADIVVASQRMDRDFQKEMDDALEREKARVAAIDREHED